MLFRFRGLAQLPADLRQLPVRRGRKVVFVIDIDDSPVRFLRLRNLVFRYGAATR